MLRNSVERLGSSRLMLLVSGNTKAPLSLPQRDANQAWTLHVAMTAHCSTAQAFVGLVDETLDFGRDYGGANRESFRMQPPFPLGVIAWTVHSGLAEHNSGPGGERHVSRAGSSVYHRGLCPKVERGCIGGGAVRWPSSLPAPTGPYASRKQTWLSFAARTTCGSPKCRRALRNIHVRIRMRALC